MGTKLFVHLEDPAAAAAALSMRLTLTPALVTLDDVLRAFCALHTRKSHSAGGTGTPSPLAPDDLEVFTEREHESGQRVSFEADKRAQRWFARRQRTADDEADTVEQCDFELVVQLEQRKLRAAKTLFETLVLPIDPENPHALLAMGDIHAANQRYDVAVAQWYSKCWAAHSAGARDGDQSPFRDAAHAQLVVDCGLKIAHCEVQRGCYREALGAIEQTQQLLQRESSGAGALASSPSAERTAAAARADFLQAQASYALRAVSPELQDAAVGLLMQLLPDLQSPSLNLDALLLYSTIAFDCGKRSDALHMVLRVLVGRPDDKAVRQHLAAFVGGSGGMELLVQAVPPDGGPSSAAAYAFIGTILKDCGALEASVACFEYAQRGNPASPAYALNHAHVLEVCNESERALAVLESFFRRNPTLATGGGQLTSREVLAVLETDGGGDPKSAAAQPSSAEEWRIKWCSSGSGYANVFLNGAMGGHPRTTSKAATLSPLEQDELDLLACFFTVVKLHRTAIRNEQAYYSCIAQLLSVSDRFVGPPTLAKAASESETPAIFVCGDSHTLATAWREIRVRGEPVVLRPALVTGLKHWHLRKHAVFYPKANFWRVLGNLPPRSTVVFLFGEIDCREGILLAVEKCTYESVEEGMAATIQIFMEALKDAVRRFGFEALVHPVVPVLNETRALVVQYNRIFKQRVDESAFCSWLDFSDDLLEPGSSREQLRPEFALDGTHLHPRYLTSLERAVNERLEFGHR
ncbi:hypothetical protein PybrP1_010063 [[Pythium] brassicae (nom. inval.)]|nr:hypothetical protein PybrP1_010063 [[Pythium] brassicae (nom. inval.)]